MSSIRFIFIEDNDHSISCIEEQLNCQWVKCHCNIIIFRPSP